VYVCVCTFARARTQACVCLCVCVCVHSHTRTQPNTQAHSDGNAIPQICKIQGEKLLLAAGLKKTRLS
jgi:hypothetical protein